MVTGTQLVDTVSLVAMGPVQVWPGKTKKVIKNEQNLVLLVQVL